MPRPNVKWFLLGFSATLVALGLTVAPAPASASGSRAGDLDDSFGDAGTVITPLGDGVITALVPLADGRAIAAGSAGDGFMLLRYLENGELDPGFGGGDGVLADDPFCAPACNRTSVYDAALNPLDGRFVVAGYNHPLAWATPAGTWDESEDLSGANGIVDIATQPDGRIVVVAYDRSGGREVPIIARFLPNGTLDKSFGKGGIAYNRLPKLASQYLGGLAIQPNGKILAVGNQVVRRHGDLVQVLLVERLTKNGRLDRSFGPNHTGQLLWNGESFGWNVMTAGRGRIVVVGDAQLQRGERKIFVTRLLPDGSKDLRFAAGGVRWTYGGAGQYVADAVMDDSRVIVVGVAGNKQRRMVLSRYQANGRFDPSFGDSGRRIVHGGHVYAAALTREGKLLVGGSVGSVGNRSFWLARFLLHG